MRALLDVNVLITLFDEEHIHFERVRRWWAADTADGWASCPLSQNGFLRVLSQPSYPRHVSLSLAREFLERQIGQTDHAFWRDDISLLDPARVDSMHTLSPRQLTDVLSARPGSEEQRPACYFGSVDTGEHGSWCGSGESDRNLMWGANSRYNADFWL